MSWQLWRQDDNGQKFLVEGFERQSEAQALLDQLEAREHKQIYWLVEERRVGSDPAEKGC